MARILCRLFFFFNLRARRVNVGRFFFLCFFLSFQRKLPSFHFLFEINPDVSGEIEL